jgi:ketosteroid isomerase-like protein
VVVELFRTREEKRGDDAAKLLDPDGEYFVGWVPPRTSLSMRVFVMMFTELVMQAPTEFLQRLQFQDIFNADGDRVVAELRLQGELPDGRQQDNVYCFVFHVTDGRIDSVREYADTWWAYELNGPHQIDMWKRLRELAPYGTTAEDFEERKSQLFTNLV